MTQRMARPRYWSSIVIGVVIIAVIFTLLPLAGVFGTEFPASQQRLYRYADQLHTGNGLVFNPDERVLLVASPVYILMLALLEIIFSTATASAILYIAAAMIGAFSLFRLAHRAGLVELPSAMLTGVFLIVSPFLHQIDSTLYIAATVSLVALEMAFSRKWFLTGLILAIGILCNPSASLLTIPLLVLASNEENGLQFLLAVIVPLLTAGVGLRLYYGPGWLQGLLMLSPDFHPDSRLWIIWLPSIAVATYGWYKHRRNAVVVLCGTWIALYIFIFEALLHIGPVQQNLFIVGPMLILIFLSLETVAFTLRLIATSVLFLVIALILFRANTDRPPISAASDLENSVFGVEASSYLRSKSPLSQSIIAFDGSLQPDVKTMIERGDIQSMLVRYAPDVLSLKAVDGVSADDLSL